MDFRLLPCVTMDKEGFWWLIFSLSSIHYGSPTSKIYFWQRLMGNKVFALAIYFLLITERYGEKSPYLGRLERATLSNYSCISFPYQLGVVFFGVLFFLFVFSSLLYNRQIIAENSLDWHGESECRFAFFRHNYANVTRGVFWLAYGPPHRKRATPRSSRPPLRASEALGGWPSWADALSGVHSLSWVQPQEDTSTSRLRGGTRRLAKS